MPSGYEQSPDYGGPPLTRWGIALGILALLVAVSWLFWRTGLGLIAFVDRAAQPCAAQKQ